MHRGAGRYDGNALAAQNANADQIADGPLDGIIGGEVLALLISCASSQIVNWIGCSAKMIASTAR